MAQTRVAKLQCYLISQNFANFFQKASQSPIILTKKSHCNFATYICAVSEVQSMSERRSNERRSERRSLFLSAELSGAQNSRAER